MICRNSIKSILRTSVKTILFALLITAVTAFFYLGVNTWSASNAMLRDWDSKCTTIITFDYLEDYGSNTGSKSEQMLKDVEGIDFDAIASNENVLLWQPADVGLGTTPGFVSDNRTAEFSDACVFIITGVRQYAEGSLRGELVESLYSFRPYEPGRNVFIENNAGDYDFYPDPDATYIVHARNERINANGLSIYLSPFYSWIAEQAGIDCDEIKPFQQIESLEEFKADKDNIYNIIAQYYNAMNNAINVSRVKEMGDLEEFNQNYLQIISGRMFTSQEVEEGANVCVISENIAKNCEVEVGDTITVNLPDDPGATMYTWGDKMSREETYTIVGIVNYHEDYFLNVYTPYTGDSARPLRYIYRLGQATVKNGSVDTFLSQIKPMLPERIFINVYDQGYQVTANALMVIHDAAIALTIIAFAVTLAVLAFFAHLFADMQREAVEVMRCFGTKKPEVRLYLMAGTSLIALVAITIGILIGTVYADNLVEYAYKFVSSLQAVDMRYSDGFRGITKEFSPDISMSLAFAALIGVSVLIIALALCLYFAEKTVSGKLIAARARVRVRRPPRKSSVALSGALRHAVLSIRRGGVRSIITPVLCAAALLFVSSLQSTLASYDAAREEIYNNTELSGYCAQMNGKYSDSLYIRNEFAKRLLDIDYITDISYVYKLNYSYLGIPVRADGTRGDVKEVPMPMNSYELDVMASKLSASPHIVFTNSVRNAPEFFYNEFHGEFMPGWDEERFASREWETLPCLIPSQFMSKNSINYGDTIRVYISNNLTYYPSFLGLDMVVVGSFTGMANQDNIYCPLPLGALDPERSTLNELKYLKENNITVSTGKYFYYGDKAMAETIFQEIGGFSFDYFTTQQLVDMLLDSKYVSAMNFKVTDSRSLGALKDSLAAAGFSSPKIPSDIQLCVVIEDAQFNENISSIDQSSKYLEILYPVLLALVCILGIITGFLTVNSRREDIALMRGLGVQKRRIFATIFGEQIMLLLIGVIFSAALLYLRSNLALLASPEVYGFFLFYAISAAFCLVLQNSKSALTILSEKE